MNHICFTSLPPELILRVIRHLRNQDIESLIRTFNSALTPVCLDALRDWLALLRNERIMITLFNTDNTSYDRNEGMRKTFEREQGRLGIFSPPPEMPISQLRLLEYLHLNARFDWMPSLEFPHLEHLWLPSPIEPAVSLEQMNTLEDTARRLGLVLPPGFAHFMTSLELQCRVRRRSQAICAECFLLEPLFKVVSKSSVALSNGLRATIDGYLCKFMEEDWSNDQSGLTESGLSWYLYLGLDGGHCVLSSDTNLFRHTRDTTNLTDCAGSDHGIGAHEKDHQHLSSGEQLVVPMILDFEDFRAKEHLYGSIFLEATSFEAFMVHDYFSEWLCAIQHGKLHVNDAPQHVREFMLRIYTEDGRNQQP